MGKYKKHLEHAKWYHGTTLEGWKQLCSNKINVKHNIGNELDFGYGFYLTQFPDQAEKYIANIIKYRVDDRQNLQLAGLEVNDNYENEIAVVIEFNFSPLFLIENGVYDYMILNSYNEDFAEFVFHNRVNNVNGEEQHSYDLIYGVMSDSLPMVLIPNFKHGQVTKEEVIEGLKKAKRNTQLSIHNQDICDSMKVTRAYIVENGEELNVNDYNN